MTLAKFLIVICDLSNVIKYIFKDSVASRSLLLLVPAAAFVEILELRYFSGMVVLTNMQRSEIF